MWAKPFYLWKFLYQQCFFLLLPWQLWATVLLAYGHRDNNNSKCPYVEINIVGTALHIFIVVVCRGYLSQLFAVDFCRKNLPWLSAVGLFCVCKQTFFLCEQIIIFCKQIFFNWKQTFFIREQNFFYLFPPYFWPTESPTTLNVLSNIKVNKVRRQHLNKGW